MTHKFVILSETKDLLSGFILRQIYNHLMIRFNTRLMRDADDRGIG